MSQPALHQLQTLLHRLTQSKPITQTDIALLDHTSTQLYSSEMANLFNQITLLLSESSERHFLEFFQLVHNYSSNPQIKQLSHSLLLRKVSKNWIAFEEDNKTAIKQFVIDTIERNIDELGDSRVLHIMNQILVSIFRFQPKGLFQDFAESLIEQREAIASRKLMNNLSIVRLIFEEAYSENQISYPETYMEFRYGIECIMVSFLTFFRFSLQRSHESNQILIKTLQIIKLSIEFIPSFDLFNCDIIDSLARLMNPPRPQYHRQISSCFEEIFRFKERSQTNDNHSKIMQKLISILQIHLLQFSNQSRSSYFQQKDSPSTESSFKSKTTKKTSESTSIKGTDILILLYQFLNKYIPYMDETKSQQNYQILSQANIKIYFSSQLYNSLKVLYPKLTNFLEIILQELDPLHIDNINFEIMEINRMVISCVRNMVLLIGKLKIELDPQMTNIIKLTICYLTPYPKDFVECYLKYQLLQKGSAVLLSLPLMSDQLDQQYRQFLKVIISQRSSSIILVTLFNNLSNCNRILYQISQTDRMKVNMSVMTTEELQKYCYLKTINQVNRVCWAAVYAFEANPQSMKDLKPMDFYRTVNNASRIIQLAPVYKCLNTNAKYVALIVFPNRPVWRVLVYAMQQSSLHQDILQLIILLLTKIFSNPTSKIIISELQIQLIIDKTRYLQSLQTFDERITMMYPAIINIIFRYTDIENCESSIKDQAQGIDQNEVFAMMISEELEPMKNSLKIIDMSDSPILQKLVGFFKRLDLIGVRIVQLATGKKIGKKLQKCISYIRSLYTQIFKDYEYKFAKFNEYLQSLTKQTFDINHYIEFCEYYIKLHELIIKFTMILYQSSPKNPSKILNSQLQVLLKGSQLLRNIFIKHKLFKSKQFFSCQRELYRFLIVSQMADSIQAINDWIIQVLASLNTWFQDESIVSYKYRFIKDIISILGLKINKVNMKTILNIFYDFYDTKLTSSQLQLIMDIVDQIVIMIRNDVYQLDKNKIDFMELIDTIKKTFQICFSSHAENEYIFDRISMILYHQIDIISKLRFSLHPQKKQDNITVLFFLLQAHISQVVNFQQDDDHNRQLKHIIHQHDLRRWKQLMKSYVFYVRRVTLEYTKSLVHD